LFVIGAVAGAAVVYGATELRDDGAERPAASLSPPGGPAAAASGLESTPTSPVTETTRSASYASARLAAYATAAAADDPFDLEALIERAAATPASRRRDMELGALLGRLAELDPRHAAETGQALRLETHFLVPIFKAWAAVDADAAIDELRNVIEPAALRTLALAVLETLGNDTRNAERVDVIDAVLT
jgi:hypothetical protein